ncbi:type II secretion system F family protein [Streptomyces sp. RO-S4]|nr:type II secretion system F family protein [Streptomyces sp. RO-S4]
MNGATGTSMGAAAACLGAVAWLLGGGQVEARRARALCAGGSAARGGSAVTGGGAVAGGSAGDAGPPGWPRLVRAGDRLRRRLTVEWASLAAGLVLTVLGASVLPVVAGAAGVPVLRRVRRAAADRRRRESRADAVIALCGALAGELRAGRQPGEALLPAARDSGGLGGMQAAVLAAARFGGDVPDALAAAARQPGAEGLRGLAACWRVAVDQGAGLADGLDRLEAALRAERDQRADLRAQLAGARATAVMLAGLPVVGLALGAALGADPLHVLLHTPSGSVCLVAGGVLEGLGLWWVLRIMRGAEEAAS